MKPKYMKIVLILFLIENDVDLLTKCGLSKNDNIRLCKVFKNKLIEQNDDYLDSITDQA